MLADIRRLWRRLRAWWAVETAPISGDNTSGTWGEQKSGDRDDGS